MTNELIRIDVTSDPKLRALAREVYRTHQPRVLRDEGEEVAMLIPVLPAASASTRFTPTSQAELDAVFQSAPTLPTPRSWAEIKQIAEEDAAEEAGRHL